MFCSGLKKTDLVVWFGDQDQEFVHSIVYDEQQLKFFYCRAVLPEYFTRCVKRGLKLYLHGGWENSLKSSKRKKAVKIQM